MPNMYASIELSLSDEIWYDCRDTVVKRVVKVYSALVRLQRQRHTDVRA